MFRLRRGFYLQNVAERERPHKGCSGDGAVPNTESSERGLCLPELFGAELNDNFYPSTASRGCFHPLRPPNPAGDQGCSPRPDQHHAELMRGRSLLFSFYFEVNFTQTSAAGLEEEPGSRNVGFFLSLSQARATSGCL